MAEPTEAPTDEFTIDGETLQTVRHALQTVLGYLEATDIAEGYRYNKPNLRPKPLTSRVATALSLIEDITHGEV